MMDKNGPFNCYNFHIFEVIVQKGECNNLLYRSTAYVFRIQWHCCIATIKELLPKILIIQVWDSNTCIWYICIKEIHLFHSCHTPLQVWSIHIHQFHLFLFQVIQIVSIPVIVLKIKTWNFLYCLWFLLTSHFFFQCIICVDGDEVSSTIFDVKCQLLQVNCLYFILHCFLKWICNFICKILVFLCDDVYVAPLVTACTNMMSIKTIAMASLTWDISMYFVFVN